MPFIYMFKSYSNICKVLRTVPGTQLALNRIITYNSSQILNNISVSLNNSYKYFMVLSKNMSWILYTLSFFLPTKWFKNYEYI